jgi:heme-degrading monooxygenase HmoA
MPLLTSVVTVTKPANAIFFDESSPEAAAKAASTRAWRESLEGFISTSLEQPDENTRIVTTLWEGLEAYRMYCVAKVEHNDHAAKKAYNDLHGIVTTSAETYQNED